jgi:Family of unknown function (DUF695)
MANAFPEQDEAQSTTEEQWSVAQAVNNGKPVLIRFRIQRPTGIEPAAFPFLLSATWSYQSDETGFPGQEELALMGKFEDALAVLEASNTAHLMVVLTGNGDRDWLWYTRGEAEAMRQVNRALKGQPRYPVQFSVQPDPSWSAYAQFETK